MILELTIASQLVSEDGLVWDCRRWLSLWEGGHFFLWLLHFSEFRISNSTSIPPKFGSALLTDDKAHLHRAYTQPYLFDTPLGFGHLLGQPPTCIFAIVCFRTNFEVTCAQMFILRLARCHTWALFPFVFPVTHTTVPMRFAQLMLTQYSLLLDRFELMQNLWPDDSFRNENGR